MFFISLIIIAVSVFVDQLIKFLVNSKIDLYSVKNIIKFGETKIFSLTHVRNSGAAWSMMSGKTWFLIALPIIVCIAAIVYIYFNRRKNKAELIGIAMFVGGGIGNLIDRIRFGEVIDYIQFEPINFPIFNFADICVTVGAVIFVLSVLLSKDNNFGKAVEHNE